MTIAIRFLDKDKTSPLGLLLVGLVSIAALAASARIQVPMYPVPVTLQTAVVLLLPCLLGWRVALGVLAAYFAAGAAGLPVFAGAITGPAYFFGPTGGYLVGFAAAMTMVGLTFERKNDMSFIALFALMIAGHALILMLGTMWLAYGVPSLGMAQAFATGVVPFLIGSVLKSALVSSAVKALSK